MTTKRQVRLDDNESLNPRFRTLGDRIFGNLSYLPSSSRLPNNEADDKIDPVAEKSGHDENNEHQTPWYGMMPQPSPAKIPWLLKNLEMAIEEKLRQVDADKTIGDTKQSVVELIRTSSSASTRSFKGKRTLVLLILNVEQSVLSVQSSYANSALSPRSISKRTDTVRELKSAIEAFGRFDLRCANIACALGDMYLEEGVYQQAFKLYREATMIYLTKLGDHHATTIDSKVRLGKVLEKTGEHDRAIELYFHALSMRKAILGDQDASVPHTLVCIASALKRKGRATQAIKELKRALKLYRTALGDSHPCVTATVDEISALYVIVGDYTKATAILEEVVKLKAATMGLNHDDVAKTLLELASAYEAAGDSTKALRSLKKCYSIQATIHGDNSDEATIALERIAQNYKKIKDSERSVAAYLGVLRGRKDHHGDTHPIVADTYLQLGIALRENNQPEKAMKCMKQSLSIYVGKGKDMNDVGMIAEVMHEMALIHRSKGQLADALKIFKQELAIRQKMGDRERYQVAITLHQPGITELELKNNTKALNFFMEALSTFEKISDQVGADFAENAILYWNCFRSVTASRTC
jgi:tetratricopeptide (TPR) repeat protein